MKTNRTTIGSDIAEISQALTWGESTTYKAVEVRPGVWSVRTKVEGVYA